MKKTAVAAAIHMRQAMLNALTQIAQWPEGAQARIACMALPPSEVFPSAPDVWEREKITMASALARIAQWPTGQQSALASNVLRQYPELTAYGTAV